MSLRPLPTTDPTTGGELIVTRLETADGSFAIEGRFSLGWVGRLSPEQLDFVGVLLRNRNNIQKLANELGVAYNTARSRLDDVVAALGGGGATDEPDPEPDEPDPDVMKTIDALAEGSLAFEEALKILRKRGRSR